MQVSDIRIELLPEAEDLGQLIERVSISPELPILHKSHNRGSRIGHILDVLAADAKRNTICIIDIQAAIKYLIGMPLKIQKHDPGLGITQAVEIRHIIVFRMPLIILGRELVGDGQTAGGLIDLLYGRDPRHRHLG